MVFVPSVPLSALANMVGFTPLNATINDKVIASTREATRLLTHNLFSLIRFSSFKSATIPTNSIYNQFNVILLYFIKPLYL